MVEWANSNQGFTSLVLTFTLVVLTAVYVFATWRMSRLMHESNRLSADNIRQVADLEKARMRPEVQFNLVSRKKVVRATIRNSGATPAINVRLSVSPPLTRGAGSEMTESPLVRGLIAWLAPNQEFEDVIDSGPQFFARYQEPRFRGSIQYADAAGNTYEERFDIDLAFSGDLLYAAEKDIGRELENVGKQLEELRRSVERRWPEA